MARALVLNATDQPLAVVPARRAVVLVLKDKAGSASPSWLFAVAVADHDKVAGQLGVKQPKDGINEGQADFHAMLLQVRAEQSQIPSNAQWQGVYPVGPYASISFAPCLRAKHDEARSNSSRSSLASGGSTRRRTAAVAMESALDGFSRIAFTRES